MENIKNLVSEKDKFYVVLENEDIIEKNTFQDITMIPYVKYYLWSKYKHTDNSTPFAKDYYQHFIINKNGDIIPLTIGNYEIIYIDEDCLHSYNDRQRTVQIRDISKNKIYSKISYIYSPHFLNKELVPLLNKLNELGSWEAYENEERIKRLEKNNESLSKHYNELQEKYKELLKKYQDLNNETSS